MTAPSKQTGRPARPRRSDARRGSPGGGLRILTYHRVDDPGRTPSLDPALVSATPEDFRRQVLHLVSRFNVVSLQDVLSGFRGERPLPERSVLLTFDDAYRDFAEQAWPTLKELGVPAVLFVPTAYPGRSDRAFWWDRLHRLRQDSPEGQGGGNGGDALEVEPLSTLDGHPPDFARMRELLKDLPHEAAEQVIEDLSRSRPGTGYAGGPSAVLDWNEIRRLSDEGVTLGAHTRLHPALTRTTDDRIREELRGSLDDLREQVGDVPAVICYPYGLHDDRVVTIAREEGFELGFTCLDGLNRVGRTDPLRLHRTNISRRTTPLLFRLRTRPWFAPFDRWLRHGDGAFASTTRASVEGARRIWARAVTLAGGAP